MSCSQEGSKWNIVVTWRIKVPLIMFLPFKIKLLLPLNGQEVFLIKNLACVEHKSSQIKTEYGTKPILPDAFSHLVIWGIKTTSNTFKFTINWDPKSKIFSKAELWPQPHSKFFSKECKSLYIPWVTRKRKWHQLWC